MPLNILSLDQNIVKKLKRCGLTKKFEKQITLLKNNPSYSSLNVELLNPKKMGIYSFRIDRKFRGLFIFRNDKKAIEILNITAHYQ